MEAKNTLNKVRTLLGMDVSLETRKLENGTMLEAEDFSTGNEVFILAEDSEKIALPKGDYILEDGTTLHVQEEGLIASLGEDRGEDDDEVAVDDWAGMEKRIKNLEDAVADLKERLSDEDEKIDDEKEEEEAEEEEVEEFTSAKQELNEIEQIAHSPEKGNAKRVTFGQTRKYANSTQQRVFEALFGDNN